MKQPGGLPMTCLALEFSTDRRSVSVTRGNEVLAEVIHQGTQRTPILTLIDSALRQSGLGRRQVDRLVVGLGPGSYTGIRLAISTAQGWQLALGTPTVGVSSLEAMAVALSSESGPILLAVDAQRSEFAVALAERGRLLEPVRLVSLQSLREQVEAGQRLAGPEVVRLIPEALEIYPHASILARLSESVSPIPAETLVPIYLREANFVKAPPSRVV